MVQPCNLLRGGEDSGQGIEQEGDIRGDERPAGNGECLGGRFRYFFFRFGVEEKGGGVRAGGRRDRLFIENRGRGEGGLAEEVGCRLQPLNVELFVMGNLVQQFPGSQAKGHYLENPRGILCNPAGQPCRVARLWVPQPQGETVMGKKSLTKF